MSRSVEDIHFFDHPSRRRISFNKKVDLSKIKIGFVKHLTGIKLMILQRAFEHFVNSLRSEN